MEELIEVFDAVAAYFSLLSEPARLRIIHSICEQEKTVSHILAEVGGTQANVSRHLNLMLRGGVLARRRDGNLAYYSAADRALVEMCRDVCGRMADRTGRKNPLRRNLLRVMPRRASARRAR